jgi:hypothetical protein
MSRAPAGTASRAAITASPAEDLPAPVATVIGPIVKPIDVVCPRQLSTTRSGKTTRYLLTNLAERGALDSTTTPADPPVIEADHEPGRRRDRTVRCNAWVPSTAPPPRHAAARGALDGRVPRSAGGNSYSHYLSKGFAMTTLDTSTNFDWTGVVDYARRQTVQPPATQYELPGVTVEDHQGVPVAVVPLWHAVVTATLTVPAGDTGALQRVQSRLSTALAEIERVYPLGPSGLFIQVAYGLPYFHRLPTELVEAHMPKSTMAGSAGQWALIDSIRYPKDPQNLVLEDNEVCVHFKSDYREHIEDAIAALFDPGCAELNGIPAAAVYVGDVLSTTTTRRGFAGHGLPRMLGMQAGIPSAEQVPKGAMLFMGFTSSHVDGLAQGNLASFETLPGYTDTQPGDYFAGGTAMHLSHIGIELDTWYGMSHSDRLHRMFDSRRTESEEVLSPDQAPATVTFAEQRDADAEKDKIVGHNAQMQFLTRLKKDTTTAYGQTVPQGTVFFLRQDFDTIENPFTCSSTEPIAATPRAGVHFIGLGPSAQHYQKVREEMDGIEHQQKFDLPDENTGVTTFLETTHRQNFLLPPRAHRCLPLVEML